MTKGCVYLLRNLINGKGYVGMTTKKPEKRWAGHIRAADAGQNQPLYAAIRKYGVENFSAEVIHKCNVDRLAAAEQRYIRQLGTFAGFGGGYNATLGGEGAFGSVHTAESKKRMSASQLRRFSNPANIIRAVGWHHTLESRKRMSEGRKGRSASASTRAKLAAACRARALEGPYFSDEVRARISCKAARRQSDPAFKLKMSTAIKAAYKADPGITERIADSLRGRKVPREVVERIRAANTGKKRTPEQRARLSAAVKRSWEGATERRLAVITANRARRK